MTARELVLRCRERGRYQLWVNQFVDDMRGAPVVTRRRMVEDDPGGGDEIAGLVAAVVDALCRELGEDVPTWAKRTASPRPFFAFPARGYAMRVRLMIESPPAFRARNVFVPATFLARA